jgi:hypothetical protein
LGSFENGYHQNFLRALTKEEGLELKELHWQLDARFGEVVAFTELLRRAETASEKWDFQAERSSGRRLRYLFGLMRREKLRIDPTTRAATLHLHPVPLPICNFQARAFGDGPKNRPACRRCRPDVYARTLQKNDILILRC